jgi:type II secretory pathway pseudopilin PulG
MTEPSTNTKISIAASFAIISSMVGIVALVIAYELAGNPDFEKVVEDDAFVLIVCSLCGFVLGFVGLFASVPRLGKPRGKNFAIAAIILGLAGLGIGPSILRFDARAKQSEAKQNLQAIYAAYQSYHSKYGTYPTSPSIQVGSTTYNCLNIVGWEPKGQLRYAYECEGTRVYWPGWDMGRSAYYIYDKCSPPITTHATKDSFTIAACGNIDADATLDEWTIDDSKHLRNVVDDVWK